MMIQRLQFELSILCEGSEGWRWSLEEVWSSPLLTVKVDPAAAYRRARMKGKVHG